MKSQKLVFLLNAIIASQVSLLDIVQGQTS
jgi:hypothetical protein